MTTDHSIGADGIWRHKDPSRFLRSERYVQENPKELVAQVGIQPKDIVVDIGCGPGFYSVALKAACKQGSLICIDASQEMLDEFALRFQLDGTTLICSAVPPVPLSSDSADVIWTANTLHEFNDLPVVILEMSRVLKTGGRLFAVDWDQVESEHGPALEKRISREKAVGIIRECGFEDVKSRPYGQCKYIVTGIATGKA